MKSCHDSAKAFSILFHWGQETRQEEVALLVPARWFLTAVTASLLIAGAFFLFSVIGPQAEGPFGTCEDVTELAVLPSTI
jgi:hypothetical protein